MLDHEIAKVCHEVNRAYCEAIGDDTQVPWDEVPDWQHKSALLGVNFHKDNPEAGASASHTSWLEEKERDGWKYGRVKDAEKKEHPCCVPFDELPREQQAKDFLFREIVHQLQEV